MEFEFKIKVGESELTIRDTADSQAKFIEKVSFFHALPKVGPNGETDLKLVHRDPKGYNYYSIVSEKAGMEYKLGQLQDKPGQLFPKGWEPIYSGDGSEQQTSGGIGPQVQTQNQGIQPQQPQPQPQTNVETPAQQPQASAQDNQKQDNNAAAQDVLSKYGIQ